MQDVLSTVESPAKHHEEAHLPLVFHVPPFGAVHLNAYFASFDHA